MAGRLESDRAVTRILLRTARAVPAAFLALFFAWPVAAMLAAHLRWGAVTDVLGDSSLRGVAWFTLWQALASTALAIVVGMPVTWALSRWRFVGSRLLTGLVTVPFLMPAVVIATGVAALLPSRGIPAILWAHTAFNVAVVVRVVGPVWSMVDRAQLESAASLGAAPWHVFVDVSWPAIRDAVRNAAALVFAFCFSSFAVVRILGGASLRTLETEVFVQAVNLGDARTATALTVLQTAVVLGVLAAARGGRGVAVESNDIVGSSPLAERAAWWWTPPVIAVLGAVVVVAPLAAVMVRSVRLDGAWTLAGWRALFDGTLERVGIDTWAVLRTSVLFAVATVCIAVPLAVLVCRRERAGFAERASLAPLLVSSVTLGLGLVVTFDTAPFDWRAEAWLLPVVHAVVALPLAVRAVGPSLRSISTDLLESAADLGASPGRVWRSVQMPLLRPALARAAGISAAVSLGEFGATSFLSRSGTMTVPIAIGQLMGRPGTLLQQAAFALAALVACAAAVFAARG